MEPPANLVDVSVAIATLSRPDGLARCLDAVLSGTVLPTEVIVVDQSADLETRQVIENRGPYRVPVIYVHQERRGLAASRNAAMAQARCRIVAVTDDDCVPGPGWLGAIAAAFQSPTPPAVVTGPVLPLGPDVPGLYPVALRTGTMPMAFTGKVIPWLVGTGGNCALQREWISRIGGYDERLGAGSPGQAAEDIDVFYRLLRAGALVRYEPGAIIYHERQTLERRTASRRGYGYGVGAFCALRLRRGDAFAARILGRWVLDQFHLLVTALRQRTWIQARHRVLSLRGTLGGLVYGFRVSRLAEPGRGDGVVWDRA